MKMSHILLVFTLCVASNYTYALSNPVLEQVQKKMNRSEHIDKDFYPSWLANSISLSGTPLTLAGYMAWILSFLNVRNYIINTTLQGSGIEPQDPILFFEPGLNMLNRGVETLWRNTPYESSQLDTAGAEAYTKRLINDQNGVTYLHQLFASGTIKPSDAVKRFYDWFDHEAPERLRDTIIKRTNGDNLALKKAKESDARWKRCRQLYAGAIGICKEEGVIKPLDGIPIVVKDEISVEGYQTSYGLDPKIVGKEFPVHDKNSQSEVVKRMDAAGVIILGKGNQHIFGLGATGLNPHYPMLTNIFSVQHVPGGSSSGSAVFVAMKGGPLALGTDGGGSVSIPAMNNGLPGLKPTDDKLPTENYDNAIPGLVAVGLIGQSFADIALAYQVTSRMYPVKSVMDTLQSIRIGVDYRWFEHASEEVANTTLECLNVLSEAIQREHDAENPMVEMRLLPKGYEKSLWATHIILFGKAKAVKNADFIYRYIPAETELALLTGLALNQASVDKARENQKRLTHHFRNNIFSKVDILAMPTSLTTAPEINPFWYSDGEFNLPKASLLTSYTSLANLTGGPRITVHCGFDSNNLPVGLQLMGDNHSEYLLMLLGAMIEKEMALKLKDSPAWKMRPQFDVTEPAATPRNQSSSSPLVQDEL